MNYNIEQIFFAVLDGTGKEHGYSCLFDFVVDVWTRKCVSLHRDVVCQLVNCDIANFQSPLAGLFLKLAALMLWW